MEEQAFVNLAVGIGRDAEIMRIGIAIVRVEIAIQVIDATHAHFPGTENAIAHLGRNAEVEVIPIKAQVEIATDNQLTFHIRHFGKQLGQDFASKAKKHQTKRCDDCKTFHFL